MLTKREIVDLLGQHGLRPKKRLGQNFLIDKNIITKMISAFSLKETDTVVEIGPGLGALTGSLAEKVRHVVAIEKDTGLCALLRERLSDHRKVTLINEDVLKVDPSRFARVNRSIVIGNLPYYITTPIITWFLQARTCFERAYITVQKELAHRMAALPGTKEYGSLSCYLQFYTHPTVVMNVRRGSFFPVPAVDSCLVRLDILKEPSVSVKDEELFFRIVHAGFNQRRKTLFNALRNSRQLSQTSEKLSEVLAACGIDPGRRAETLSLEEFAQIANGLT